MTEAFHSIISAVVNHTILIDLFLVCCDASIYGVWVKRYVFPGMMLLYRLRSIHVNCVPENRNTLRLS